MVRSGIIGMGIFVNIVLIKPKKRLILKMLTEFNRW